MRQLVSQYTADNFLFVYNFLLGNNYIRMRIFSCMKYMKEKTETFKLHKSVRYLHDAVFAMFLGRLVSAGK